MIYFKGKINIKRKRHGDRKALLIIGLRIKFAVGMDIKKNLKKKKLQTEDH